MPLGVPPLSEVERELGVSLLVHQTEQVRGHPREVQSRPLAAEAGDAGVEVLVGERHLVQVHVGHVQGVDPYSKHMSLPVLRGIYKLVEQGAVVSGEKPTDTPSLADDAAEFKKLNDELFGDGTGVHSVGKGKVYAGQNAEATLKALSVAPDFEHTKPQSDTRILFVHRKLADADIYFLDNRNDRDETVDASFRVTGKAPELWYAETGKWILRTGSPMAGPRFRCISSPGSLDVQMLDVAVDRKSCTASKSPKRGTTTPWASQRTNSSSFRGA